MPQFKEFFMFRFQLDNVIHTAEFKRLWPVFIYRRSQRIKLYRFCSSKNSFSFLIEMKFFLGWWVFYHWLLCIHLSILFFWWRSSWCFEYPLFCVPSLCTVLVCVYLGMSSSNIIFFPFFLLRISYTPCIHLMPPSDLGGFVIGFVNKFSITFNLFFD